MNDLYLDKEANSGDILIPRGWTPTAVEQMHNVLRVWLKILDAQPDILNESEVVTTNNFVHKKRKYIKKG